MSIVRFQTSYTDQGVTFNAGQEWEMIDMYTGLLDDPCDDCPPKLTKFYRFKYPVDDKIYTAPETVVVIIDKHTTNNRTATTQQEKWDAKVTRDQIAVIYDKEDYVKAAEEFMGLNIAAKKRQDQADYQKIWPTSAYFE